MPDLGDLGLFWLRPSCTARVRPHARDTSLESRRFGSSSTKRSNPEHYFWHQQISTNRSSSGSNRALLSGHDRRHVVGDLSIGACFRLSLLLTSLWSKTPMPTPSLFPSSIFLRARLPVNRLRRLQMGAAVHEGPFGSNPIADDTDGLLKAAQVDERLA